MDTQSSITVINPVDGKRYKMTMKGDVARLTVRKMKRYLVSSCGVPAEEQLLKYNGVELGDDVMGGEVGITTGSTLTVERRGAGGAPFIASPTKQALEMETLDQQKTMLQHERMRREEEFRRQQDTLKTSQAHAEKRRIDLERERQEKELELKRINELESAAEAERTRLANVRQQEADREAARVRDLESRKSQLSNERELQRQLEMQKLENERKRMLLQQQQAEYESERARLERERREYQERVKKQELAIREREVDLERVHIESERAKKELELEKQILSDQRDSEYEKLHHDRLADFSSQTVRQLPAAAAHSDPYGAVHSPAATQRRNSTPYQPSQSAGTTGTVHTPRISAKERELDELRQMRASSEAERQREDELDRLIAAERAALNGTNAPTAAPPAPEPPLGTNMTPRGTSPNIAPVPQPQPQHVSPGSAYPAQDMDAKALALDNLKYLAQDIGVPTLQLDDNNTCVVSVEEKYTLLITFDPATERIYLYSTLTTFIPKNPDTKLKLYEFLLEGALLGRDMCGGGVGASMKNDFILMSTSIFLPKSQPSTLRTVVPVFVDVLVRWRNRVKDLLQSCNEVVPTETGSDVSNFVAGASNNGAAPTAPPPAGGPSHSSPPDQPMLGLEVTDGVVIDGVLQKYSDGVVVVQSKGPASRAGILPNDFIRGVNGRRVTSMQDFQEIARSLRPHTTVPLSVDRAGSQLIISVLIGSSRQRPGEQKYKNVVRVNDTNQAQNVSGAAPSPNVSIARGGGHVY